jgi:hypothetical protein
VRLEGEERDLRDLAMHFNTPSLEILEEEGAFWLGSRTLWRLRTPKTFCSAAESSSPALQAHYISNSAASRLRVSRQP